MQKRHFRIILIITCCIQLSCFTAAQTYSETMKVPPVKVYETIFEFIQKKDYKQVEAAIGWVLPVINSIKKNLMLT